MIKITNGVNIFEVSKGAFKSFFAPLGYKEVKKEKEEQKQEQKEEKSEDEIFVEEMKEIPLSQWSKEDAKKFAKIQGINLKGAKTFTEVQEILKDFVD